MLEYKGYLFGDGAHIVGTIQGKPVEGKLHIEGTNYYFCQNEMLGTAGDNLHGYEYSWIFRKKGDTLTDGVEIFTEEQPEKPKIEFNKNVFDSRFVKTRILSGDISFSYYNKFDLKFNMHKIPNDASMIISNINLFNDLDDLSDEVKNSVLNLLKKSLKRVSNHFIVVTYDKSRENMFFEQDLEFFRVNTWKDKITGEAKNLLIWSIA